jgi:hypothetical protein
MQVVSALGHIGWYTKLSDVCIDIKQVCSNDNIHTCCLYKGLFLEDLFSHHFFSILLNNQFLWHHPVFASVISDMESPVLFAIFATPNHFLVFITPKTMSHRTLKEEQVYHQFSQLYSQFYVCISPLFRWLLLSLHLRYLLYCLYIPKQF